MPVAIDRAQLWVSYKGKMSVIDLCAVEFIEAEEWLCKIYTAHETVLCAVRLGHLCQQLKAYGFIRCHKGYIVNIRNVRSATSSAIVTSSGRIVPIGRSYKERFKTFVTMRTDKNQ